MMSRVRVVACNAWRQTFEAQRSLLNSVLQQEGLQDIRIDNRT